MKLILIPAGEFTMGSAESEGGHEVDEAPPHRVRISQPFYLGVFEVTQAEYRQVMGTNPSYAASTGDGRKTVEGLETGRFPVENVSWDDAHEFCRRLSAKEGRRYRLPTEAEWEYACRAGTATEFSSGNGERALAEVGWYGFLQTPRGNSPAHVSAVGQKRANAFDLYDMHGNVCEWCDDWYGDEYYAKSPPADPKGPSDGLDRVYRGGGWRHLTIHCRSAFRDWLAPDERHNALGFRVVLVLAK